MKNFLCAKYFSPEKSESVKNYATLAYPELKKLALTPEQERARSKALAKLDAYILDISKFSRGNAEAWVISFIKHMATRDATMEEIQEQMRGIRALLLQPYKANDWNEVLETHLNVIGADGTANLETVATTMSKRVFLQRIIGASEAAKILQENNPSLAKLEAEKNTSEKTEKQKSRLGQFLVALESEEDGMIEGLWRGMRGKAGLDSEIRHTQTLLLQWDFDGAVAYAKEKFNNKWTGVKIENILDSNKGLAEALRAIKHTDAAENALLTEISAKNTQEKGGQNEKEKAFYEAITPEKIALEKEKYLAESEKMYKQAIDALPPNDPDRMEMMQNPDKYIQGFANGLSLKNLVSEYIKKNGSEDLPDEMKILDDMRGLHGKLNFTDENARLFKEIAIIVASMIITMGATGVAAAGAATARGAATASKMARVGSALKNGMWAMNATMSRNAVTGVVHNALVFTTTETAIRSLWPDSLSYSAGEKGGFVHFLDNVSKNTVLFGSFVGMEKFLTSGIISKIPFIRALKVNPSQTISIGNALKLSAGDIAVIHALYAAENGKLESDWKILAGIVVLRRLSLFPKLHERFSKLPKNEQENILKNLDDSTKTEVAKKNSGKDISEKNISKNNSESINNAQKTMENMPEGTKAHIRALDENGKEVLILTQKIDGKMVVLGVENNAKIAFNSLNAVEPGLGNKLSASLVEAKSGKFEKFQKFFTNHWAAISSGPAGMMLFRAIMEQEKTNPFAFLPDELPKDPQKAFEECMQCFLNNQESTLDYHRKSVSGKELDEKYRMDISRRWMKTKDWKELMVEWGKIFKELEKVAPGNAKILQEKFDTINKNPTVSAVKDLQKCINMIAEDNSSGQDGILWPRTTKAIHDFILACQKNYHLVKDAHKKTEVVAEKVWGSKNAENTWKPETIPENTSELPEDISKFGTIVSDNNIAKTEILTP